MQIKEGCLSYDSVLIKIKGWGQTCMDLVYSGKVRSLLKKTTDSLPQNMTQHTFIKRLQTIVGAQVLLPLTRRSPSFMVRAITFHLLDPLLKPKCWFNGHLSLLFYSKTTTDLEKNYVTWSGIIIGIIALVEETKNQGLLSENHSQESLAGT